MSKYFDGDVYKVNVNDEILASDMNDVLDALDTALDSVEVDTDEGKAWAVGPGEPPVYTTPVDIPNDLYCSKKYALDSESARDDSETAQAASEAAQVLSEAARDKSQDWATEAEDVEVETGEYSSYHWAQKALGAWDPSTKDIVSTAPITIDNITIPAEIRVEVARDAFKSANLVINSSFDVDLDGLGDTAVVVSGTGYGHTVWGCASGSFKSMTYTVNDKSEGDFTLSKLQNTAGTPQAVHFKQKNVKLLGASGEVLTASFEVTEHVADVYFTCCGSTPMLIDSIGKKSITFTADSSGSLSFYQTINAGENRTVGIRVKNLIVVRGSTEGIWAREQPDDILRDVNKYYWTSNSAGILTLGFGGTPLKDAYITIMLPIEMQDTPSFGVVGTEISTGVTAINYIAHPQILQIKLTLASGVYNGSVTYDPAFPGFLVANARYVL